MYKFLYTTGIVFNAINIQLRHCIKDCVFQSRTRTFVRFRNHLDNKNDASMMRSLQGILHAGAVLDSSTISGMTLNGIRREASGKVHGGWNLIRMSDQAPLSILKFFSSLAAFSGSGGQGSYAAANAALDHWAESQQVRPCL